MMHKFSKTGEYAKKRLKIALAEDRSAISASDNMTQIKKEISKKQNKYNFRNLRRLESDTCDLKPALCTLCIITCK